MKNVNPYLRFVFRNTGDGGAGGNGNGGAAGAGAGGGAGAGKGGAAGAGGAGGDGAGGGGAAGAGGAEGEKPQGDGKGGAPARVVPEKYELTVPDGDKAWVSDRDTALIAETAKASQWTQDEAASELAAMIEERKATHTALLAETQAHPEIGGDKLEVAQKHALLAMNRLLPEDTADGKRFRADINRLGLSSYAPLVLLLSRVGRLMAEDQPGAGNEGGAGGSGNEGKTTEEVLWPAK